MINRSKRGKMKVKISINFDVYHIIIQHYYYYSRFSIAKKHVVIKIIITIIIRHTHSKQRTDCQSKCTENSITGCI